MRAITTIKLQKSTKSALANIKDEFESYDTAVRKLISTAKNANLKAELIEAYKSMGKKDLDMLEDWDQASNEVTDHD